MRRLRQIHLYLGSLFAPAILFFAFSGVLQTFDLHKDHHGQARPPAWIVMLSSVHKNMRLPRPKPAESKALDALPHPMAANPVARPADAERSGRSTLPLKIFVLGMATGLIVTTLIGVFIALKNKASRLPALVLLSIGIVLPVALLLL